VSTASCWLLCAVAASKGACLIRCKGGSPCMSTCCCKLRATLTQAVWVWCLTSGWQRCWPECRSHIAPAPACSSSSSSATSAVFAPAAIRVLLFVHSAHLLHSPIQWQHKRAHICSGHHMPSDALTSPTQPLSPGFANVSALEAQLLLQGSTTKAPPHATQAAASARGTHSHCQRA
jgi:hypothetical protein